MKPAVNGRASICTWTLTASFLTKKQAVTAIENILAENINFHVSYSVHWSDTQEHHLVEIEEMSWARNLATVAAILEGIDCKEDGEE